MSDIGLPPGLGIFIVALGLAALTGFLALIFLIIGLIGQKSFNFTHRKGFCLLLGMVVPLAFSGIGMLAASYAPAEWLRATDRMNPAWLFSVALLSVAIGIALGLRRYKSLHKTTS